VLAVSQENLDVVRRWWQGFNEDGMPPLSLCDDKIELDNGRDFPVGGLFRGHEGVRRWRDQMFEIVEDARVEPEKIVDVHGDGKIVLMLLRATGKASYTQLEMEVEWAAIWTIRDGKVLRCQGYLNRADALRAAGVSE
jgi:ketosteroid isomerase-like protein